MKKLTRLKLAILEGGFTQREIARRAGMDETILSMIANGKYIPDKVQRARIATALQRSEAEIFGS